MKNALLLSLCLGLFASPASGLDVETGLVDVTFHISHPAKEYDAHLTPDGGRGAITLEPGAIEKTRAKFTILVDHFDSQNTRRDSHMVEVMEALVFPTIEWSVESVGGASGAWTPGTHTFQATGPLTVHGVTKPLTTPVTVTVAEDGSATFASDFTILLEDYAIERPTLVFVPIDNELPIKVKVRTKANPDLFAKPAPAPEPVEAPAEAEGETE